MKYCLKLLSILLLIVSFSCTQKQSLVENRMWKHRSGYHIGDAFIIDNIRLKIVNDTFYENNIPIATFVNIERRFFEDNILTIKSLTKNEIGQYCEK